MHAHQIVVPPAGALPHRVAGMGSAPHTRVRQVSICFQEVSCSSQQLSFGRGHFQDDHLRPTPKTYRY
eukprot:6480669-Amphidinium_carterae.1